MNIEVKAVNEPGRLVERLERLPAQPRLVVGRRPLADQVGLGAG